MPTPISPSAVAPAEGDAAYNLEVVCRTQSVDREPTNDPQNEPIPVPSLDKAQGWGRKAKVHPSPSEILPEKTNGNGVKPAGNGSPATVHVSARAGEVPRLYQSSSVFDMLDHHRTKPRAGWKVKVGRFLDGIPFTIVSIIFTMLVSNDVYI